ncbi:disintegrin and metalloproteinase domain-containing protein 20-like [Sorex fumeus]|uniref:disintegrin and metalloproteinase domain-containing protein 20-like n=1 Tax=Sorex fumeus TaxID=62283 RepID=UPI0024AD9CE0|nr:disintegrin and metalloproteinase domain-containing protein 20-like [Sorex fumeus]
MAETWPLVPTHWQVSLGLGMRLAEGQSPPRTPLLLLTICVLLAPARCSPGRPSWRYVSSEVVVPRKELYQGTGVPLPGWLSYSLRFGGQRHVIRMRRKTLFMPGPPLLLTQDEYGSMQADYPFIPADCYYLGYLEETPLSMVTLDTCYGGLNGIMKLDDLTYEIKPLKDSRRFEHVVSQLEADAQATGPASPPGDTEDLEPLLPRRVSESPRLSAQLYATHHGHIQGLFMSSFSTYSLFQNVTECAKFLVRIGSLIDTFLRGIDLRVYVYILLIFNTKDPAQMNDYRVPGGAFHTYYRYYIYLELFPDVGFIVITGGPLDHDFSPSARAICNDENLVMLGHGDRHFLLLSITATNHLGRIIGLYYDTPECVCQRRSTCLMYRYPEVTDSFSNCSFAHMSTLFYNSYGKCMFSSIVPYPNRTRTQDRCGNRAVGPREECDCGSLKECSLDACCTTECQLTPGTQCHVGDCCEHCMHTPAGSLCRPIMNICDLPEYCLGTHHACPDNTYVQDGTPCSEESYCFQGNCTDRTMQCQEIFGQSARNGEGCYMINALGYRYGHCGRNPENRIPKKCDWADVQCGRLQCTNVTNIPQLPEHVGFHQSLVREDTTSLCFGLDEHRATVTADVGQVRNGAPCSRGKFCINNKCDGVIRELTYDCTPEKCNHRGICNNHKSCHCRAGWKPPKCTVPGSGGSKEGGQPRFRKLLVIPNKAKLIELRVIFCRVYMFVAALLLGVAANSKTILAEPGKEENEAKEAQGKV